MAAKADTGIWSHIQDVLKGMAQNSSGGLGGIVGGGIGGLLGTYLHRKNNDGDPAEPVPGQMPPGPMPPAVPPIDPTKERRPIGAL